MLPCAEINLKFPGKSQALIIIIRKKLLYINLFTRNLNTNLFELIISKFSVFLALFMS